jgi:hypothetical protein
MNLRALLAPALSSALGLFAQTGKVAIVSLASHVHEQPTGASADKCRAEAGDTLVLLSEQNFSNYYKVQAPNGCAGFIYRNRVRLRISDPPSWSNQPGPATSATDRLTICSFNIKWLGLYTKKAHQAIADLLAPYDIVVIQELVSPPRPVTFSDGVSLDADPESAGFFDAMHALGFRDALSTENTGRNSNHGNSAAAEWFVAFYRDDVVRYDEAQSGFVDGPLVHNTTFDRVPWSFHFTCADGSLDLSLISVHLKADGALDDERRAELRFIADWAAQDPSGEKDHIILGDMNIQDADECGTAFPTGFTSLNSSCVPTNTGGSKPFDHVLYKEASTGNDIDRSYGFTVVDLRQRMRVTWTNPTLPYPGDPYDSGLFSQYYSDHDPVVFRLKTGGADDD